MPDRACAATGLMVVDLFSFSFGILLIAIVMLLCYLCANTLLLLPLLLLAYASKPDWVMLHCCSPLAACGARRTQGQPGLSGEGGWFDGLGGDPVYKPRLYTRHDWRIEEQIIDGAE